MQPAGNPVLRLPLRVQLGRTVADLVAGLVVGMLCIALSVSLGTILYAGELSRFLPRGVGLALISSALLGLTAALRSSLPGMIAHIQDAPAAILAVAAAGIASTAALAPGSEALFMTVAVTVALTTLLTAGLFLVTGGLRLGRIVRYVPFPVVGGFLAGTGWLLLLGGLGTLTGTHLELAHLPSLLAPETINSWLPGVGFAVCALILTRRMKHVLVWPGLIAGGTALFYLVMAFSGGSRASWQESGLLLGSVPGTKLWLPLDYAALGSVDWQVVLQQLPVVTTVAFVSLMSVLLNTTGLELALGRRIDLNRELHAAGLGNLLAGLAGGPLGYQVISSTALNHRIGSGGRAAPLISVALVALVLMFGGDLLGFMPTAIVGGLVIYLGLSFLAEWVVDSRSRLSPTEYAVTLLILVVIAFAGFLTGVAVGMLLTIFLFVFSYGRVDAMRFALTGAHLHSRVRRSEEELLRLDGKGEELLVLALHGYLFFGTAHRLAEVLEERLARGRLRFILLDLSRVSGADSTALNALAGLVRARTQKEAQFIVAAAPGRTEQRLRQAVGRATPFSAFATLDEALEWYERQQLAAAENATNPPMDTVFDTLLGGQVRFSQLLPYLERQDLAAGEHLMRTGEPSDFLCLIAAGSVTTYTEGPDGQRTRLESMAAGSLVGELGFFTGRPRSASVVTEGDVCLYRLGREALERMELQEPALALRLQRLIVRLLAGRVTHLMKVVDALQR